MTRGNLYDDDPTVRRAGIETAASPVRSYTIEVVEGPAAGLSFRVDSTQPSRTLIGKSPACAVLLADPEVSRRHAAIEVVGRRLRITDLESSNGTSVDGVSIKIAFLRGGETLRMGRSVFRVRPEVVGDAVVMPGSGAFGKLLGTSPAMRKLFPLCERLATSNVPVVIEGETGTGKEQLSEALHEQGPRAGKPFIVLDCTTIAPSLIESELLGHEKGAFTGAQVSREGVFERAQGGTLLIDEIGDLPLELQPKLLRAIERSTVVRVGGSTPVHVDVRLLVATRRDLDREVQLGRFRDDLFHRIAVARVELPPLRERTGDVVLLARHFAAELGGDRDAIPSDLLLRWADHDWPGNVRELRNAVARRLALGDLADDGVRPPTGPGDARVPRHAASNQGDAIARVLSMGLPLVEAREKLVEEFEQRYVEHGLETSGGNVTRAAAAAGVTRRHFQRLRLKT